MIVIKFFFFAKEKNFPEEFVFNLLILKFLRSDQMRGNMKYVMIIRNLENWLKRQQRKICQDSKNSSRLSLSDLLAELVM